MAVTYEPIASTTVGSGGVASVTFGSGNTLPQTYTDLLVVISGTSEVVGNGNYNVTIRFNGDTNNNYSGTYLVGNGSAASSSRGSNASSLIIGGLPGTTTTGISPSASVAHIMSYSNTNVFKTIIRATGSSDFIVRSAELWRSTSAITSMELTGTSGDIAQGTTLSLYGIKAA